jgi:hypothetical protein
MRQWNANQLAAALKAVREYGGTARSLSDHILTSKGEPVTPNRAMGLLRELERRGSVRRWKRPGTRAWLWTVAGEGAGDDR